MKNFKILFVLLIIMFSTTSCWEFNRKQRFLNAKNNGESILIEAESSKKAMIEDAKARNESATLEAQARIKIAEAEAQAEIVRAKGVAEANKIIGESLKGNDIYLRYLQIDAIKNATPGEKIYIPTEAGLPILEVKK